MRLHRVCTTLIAATALGAATLVVTVPGAAALRATGDSAAGRLKCPTGVVGFDAQHRVRYDVVDNDVVTESYVSTKTLDVDVTGWGFYDSSGRGRHRSLRLNVVASDGVPRNLTIKQTKKSIEIGRVRRYDQDGFAPRLFADGGTYFAYSLKGGTLKRSALTRFRNGELRYIRPVRVAKGLRDLTSLQAPYVGKIRGVESELLYATTADGKLLQIVVPLARPGRARVRTLAKTGYAGVTELSWSVCNGTSDYHSLVAIDPVANRATWTTIKHALGRPKAQLRGDVVGQADWHLAAAL